VVEEAAAVVDVLGLLKCRSDLDLGGSKISEEDDHKESASSAVSRDPEES
jgi:hypothetical protein